jgi:uncharacterized protein (DUF2141 family)
VKYKITLFPAIVMMATLVSVQIPAGYTLDVEITSLRNNTGFIMLQVLNESQVPVEQRKGVIQDLKYIVKIVNLPPGKYAIRYFHDENINGNLDTNKMGIPTEGYGFSNNAYGLFGPKPFKEWLFDLNENKKLSLKIKY